MKAFTIQLQQSNTNQQMACPNSKDDTNVNNNQLRSVNCLRAPMRLTLGQAALVAKVDARGSGVDAGQRQLGQARLALCTHTLERPRHARSHSQSCQQAPIPHTMSTDG